MPDENLLKFIESVMADAQSQRDQLLHELDEKKKDQLDTAEMEILKNMYKNIQEEIEGIKNRCSLEISKTGYDARLELLSRRNEISKKVFDILNDKIEEFSHSEEYKIYLSRKLLFTLKDKFREKADITVLVAGKDLADAKNITAALGTNITVREYSSIKYGGFILLAGAVKYDESVDKKLEEQYQKFYEISGLTIEN